jgi:hypothetical protein
MADLSDINASQSVKIIGANTSGVETTPVNASSNGDIQSSDLLLGPGVQSALTVGTSAVELIVGVSPLANRKLITLFNNSNSTIYWGYTNSVTTVTGTPIFKDQFVSWDMSDKTNAKIFLIAGSASNNTRITESA